jgi:hypothetical protein
LIRRRRRLTRPISPRRIAPRPSALILVLTFALCENKRTAAIHALFRRDELQAMLARRHAVPVGSLHCVKCPRGDFVPSKRACSLADCSRIRPRMAFKTPPIHVWILIGPGFPISWRAISHGQNARIRIHSFSGTSCILPLAYIAYSVTKSRRLSRCISRWREKVPVNQPSPLRVARVRSRLPPVRRRRGCRRRTRPARSGGRR